MHHNDLRDGVVDLDRKAFTPYHVREDPLIFTGSAVKRPKPKPSRATDTTKRDNVTPPEATE